MKKILMMVTSIVLIACSPKTETDDKLTLNSKFDSTWNIHESVEHNSDGSITYHALPWCGLAGNMRERNLPVDWSNYESLTVEFTEPTKVGTQIMISHQLTVYGKVGITSLVCYFDGQNVTSIDEVGIQAADSCTLVIKRVYLTPGTSQWDSTPIWEGECVFGNWENGISVEPDKFKDAKPGDQLEFIYQVDKNDPSIIFWLFKTIYKDTDKTLEGNDYQLNEWGCSPVGEGGVFRIHLTANDVKELNKHGLFTNGYYNIVSQINLLRRGDTDPNAEENY